METVTIYQQKAGHGFRVVVGAHEHKVSDTTFVQFSITKYQGADRQAAIDAAYADCKREDIRAQLERFGITVMRENAAQLLAPSPKFLYGEWVRQGDEKARQVVNLRMRRGRREYLVESPQRVGEWIAETELHSAKSPNVK